MKLLKNIILLMLFVCFSVSSFSEDKSKCKKESLKEVVSGNNRFALEFYSAVKVKGGNLFFSPYSISTALGMTYGGAKGKTATQMAKVLHFPRFFKGYKCKQGLNTEEKEQGEDVFY